MAEHGTFTWNELVTRDPESCKTFFTQILGWTARDVEMPAEGPGPGIYTVFMKDGKDVAGMFKLEGPAAKGVPNHWMSYIAVDDVDAACDKAEKLGGEIKVHPTTIPGVGRFCVIADPTGATVSLLTSEHEM
jgi:predicted enzyme related to lactoylglutathione lyase